MATSQIAEKSANPTHLELMNLSGEHRDVIVSFNNGKGYEAIAAELGLPIGTVRSRLNRARKAIIAMREAAPAQAAE